MMSSPSWLRDDVDVIDLRAFRQLHRPKLSMGLRVDAHLVAASLAHTRRQMDVLTKIAKSLGITLNPGGSRSLAPLIPKTDRKSVV